MSATDDALANIRPDAYAHVAGLDAAINETDKVYRNAATGAFVKVRAVRVPAPPPPPDNPNRGAGAGFGMVVVEISGAVCDAAGAALPHGEGHAIAPAQRHTFQSDQPANLSVQLERLRRDVACAAERAAFVEAQLSGGALPR